MDNFLYLPRATASALYDLSFAAAVGILLCRLWLPEANLLQRRLRLAFILVSLTLFATLTAQLWLTTATMLGTTQPSAILAELHDVLTSTHAGRLAALAIPPALVLLALSVSSLRLQRTSKTTLYASLITLFAMVILRSATGHAASNGDFTFDELIQLLHLAATAVWAGTLLAAGLLLASTLASNPSTISHLGNRISRAATSAILLVIATGVYKSWRGLGGTLSPLAHTQWGILLSIKTALVSIALLQGLYNRRLLQRNQQLIAVDATAFAGSLRLEALVMFAILTLSGFLANSPPATGS
jgi:putative copper resistance protein D